MIIKILTLFPEAFASINHSIIGRAIASRLLSVEVINIRDYSTDKHRRADDDPYGGGAGMVMTAQPIISCVRANADGLPEGGRRVCMSPRGSVFNQRKAEELAGLPWIMLICGHYEGIDQRAIDLVVDEELSIGDYVLTGGEPAVLVVMDAVARLLPGVLGNAESASDESFGASGLLEYPQYTHPRVVMGLAVPDVLLSGDHAKINAWRREQALRITRRNRPDLL
ncbi:MAG: tRNA (guanosine(37)-N1)-methyltransferase TrmD [Oscillospiraceae bacterium]|jgi:tRNA (guanine37-N1)-methyltransferase|nr:tRNA (guanosine(37)-N1)-methyltransferase TrmD [Oscillospiraceae bacterium]